MNLKSPGNYGVLPLTPAFANAVQLEWEMVEQPAPARFMNFPFVDHEAGAAAPANADSGARGTQKEPRPLAA